MRRWYHRLTLVCCLMAMMSLFSPTILLAQSDPSLLCALQNPPPGETGCLFQTTTDLPNEFIEPGEEVAPEPGDPPPETAVFYDFETALVMELPLDPGRIEVDEGFQASSDDFTGCYPDACGGASPEAVFLPDGRVRILRTTAFPYRALTKLEATYPGSLVKNSCSGALVGPCHVLTSAHCVHRGGTGGALATEITVSPGQNGTKLPFGRAQARWAYMYDGWTRYRDQDWDMALIILDRTIGNLTGWFGRSTGPPADTGSVRSLAGYPIDRAYGTLWYDSGLISAHNAFRLFYLIDAASAQSGSPIWEIKVAPINRLIRAVNRGDTRNAFDNTPQVNDGVRLTRGKYDDISRWIAMHSHIGTICAGRADNGAGGSSGTGAALDPETDPCENCGPDCNDNFIDDALDLVSGTSHDFNENGIPDECDRAIPTLSPWGILAMVLLIVTAGAIITRRHANR